MSAVERVRELVQPLVEQENAVLYDIEHESGLLRIMVDAEGGIDVDTIGALSTSISDALDVDDPIPDSRYLLEVTSPGIERRLRLPEHYRAQIGEDIAIKVKRLVAGDRRFEARLEAVSESGIDVVVIGNDELSVVRTIPYDDIEMARLIFRWEDQKGQKTSNSTTKAGKAGHNSITTKKASAR